MWFDPGELSKTESQPPANSEIIVTCYTPAGNPIQVEARNAEHAEFLQRMNPEPIIAIPS